MSPQFLLSDGRWALTHPLRERPGRADVEHLGHVLGVALLGHVAQFGRDVDASADVHVHLPGFLLDLCVQLGHLLQDPGWRQNPFRPHDRVILNLDLTLQHLILIAPWNMGLNYC